ncbi:DinB family protein [Flavobacterium nitrogenifigens]|uniref:DinB superfamily protein n=1 Tax=Flavobacterium nitrogenifigens TaxID=1617283 RepID=A0A521DZH3_9FLAO|nr:DinB family protein [Flavobacterium nitrogenifigens]KAF2333951.1 DinB family protein [Flavobacterium nitrogenifigens]SMO77123.1 DinB superfamily protein [Flavobacterium nitrogenifigens]
MKSAIQNIILETYSKLDDLISSFSKEEINIVPFEGSWTAGQTAQHIILAYSGLTTLFAGKTEKTTREPDKNIKGLDSIFLDYTTKYQSPENIKPPAIEYEKGTLLASVKKIQNDLYEAAETYDLTLTCLDAKIPGFENFTIYEWLHFAIIHTQRHTHQLKTIYEHIKKQ